VLVCGHTTRRLEGEYSRTSDSGAQPLVNDDESVSLAVNGEIYNHRVLRKGLKNPYNFKTHSDCEVIIPLVWVDLL
jgi:asparagine synthetase B (glutamine-hydrolysing)